MGSTDINKQTNKQMEKRQICQAQKFLIIYVDTLLSTEGSPRV